MPVISGLPGGAQENSLTTTEVAVDLSALANMEVLIWSDDQDIWFCFTPASETSTTLITSGDSAASKTSLKADRAAKSVGKLRVVNPKYPRLVVKTATGTGTLHVKCTKETDAYG